MKRGEVWTVAGPGYASKPRPAVIIQDDRFDMTDSVTVCLLTTTEIDAPLGRVPIEPSAVNNLTTMSYVMIDKVAAIARIKVREHVGDLTQAELARINSSLVTFLGIAG